MFSNIVVTVDDPREQQQRRDCTLDCAAMIAQRLDANVSMVQIHAKAPVSELEGLTPYRWEGIVEARDASDRRIFAAQIEEMQGMGQRLDLAWGVGAEQHVTRETTPEGLQRLIESVHGDLLVARYGPEPCPTTHLGEISEDVMRRVRVPVLFIPSGTCPLLKGAHEVLVALDGTPESETVLPLVMGLLAPGRATLHLMSVVGGSRASLRPRSPVLRTKERAAEYLASVAQRRQLKGLIVETVVRQSADPATALLEEAHRLGADLLAMTSRGYTGLARALFGSITHRVLEQLDRPLLVAPARAVA